MCVGARMERELFDASSSSNWSFGRLGEETTDLALRIEDASLVASSLLRILGTVVRAVGAPTGSSLRQPGRVVCARGTKTRTRHVKFPATNNSQVSKPSHHTYAMFLLLMLAAVSAA